MGLSNSDFFSQMGALFAGVSAGTTTPSSAATAFTALAAQWVPLSASNPAVGAQQLQLLTLWQATPTEYATFASGTATGGFHEDGTPSTGAGDALAGYYPITGPGGSQVFIPCPAKMGLTAPGQAANVSLSTPTSEATGQSNADAALAALAARKLDPSAWVDITTVAGVTQPLPWTVAANEVIDVWLGDVHQKIGRDFTVAGTNLIFDGAGSPGGETMTVRKLSVA